MKKFYYFFVLALVFASCSTDTDTDLLQEGAVQVSTIDEFNAKTTATTTSCITFLYGSTTVDVSQGLNNPRVIFIADVPNGNASRPSKFTVSLEIQPLSECEDLTSGTGDITRYSLQNFSIPAVTDPTFTLTPSQLPTTCYRWRFVVEGFKVTSTSSTPCITTSIWYDEPLF